ncbi:hypothetical protein LTR96_005744 [Exophiala xenobiotica]|uniref:Carboxymuconolactone decarboxylase-like domain-containing protein n=1 Tax=Vermiconidia calcicola TaxID=1690605 RepID=A0AAV9PXU3_9PEZI|nr:hypothetical protein LTR92_002311 [Exophiala xenobiotica]KAK5530843.1 hypothetical protein LTR25_008700 [Vermiconidia calcicola]KAK5531238.1 hypothetical protein LTR23_010005 [Chaetothyriales sp. CCFEE 6169]KAK5210402.1 hypothetical protein LTR41_004070 [Exophiala xenobiotica]KAK5228384.1 hypothetical protein LTR72_002267 [Exophiala xenobiotica]
MSNRLGLTPPTKLTDEQKPVQELFGDYTKARYDTAPQTSLEDGTLIGPFAILLHHPQLGEPFYRLAQGFRKIPGLSPYGREVVIAVAGARSQAAYENYAHAIIAHKEGISEAELHDIHAGRCPETLTEEGKVAFELATALGKPGVLEQGIWDNAVKVLGRDGAAAAVHYTGFYSYVGTILKRHSGLGSHAVKCCGTASYHPSAQIHDYHMHLTFLTASACRTAVFATAKRAGFVHIACEKDSSNGWIGWYDRNIVGDAPMGVGKGLTGACPRDRARAGCAQR